jgi:hypothetical protein
MKYESTGRMKGIRGKAKKLGAKSDEVSLPLTGYRRAPNPTLRGENPGSNSY